MLTGRPKRRVVIIGNGIAGVTTARRLRDRDPDCGITLVSGESLDFWSRPALMYVYMGHMRLRDTQPYPAVFWERQRIERVQAWVVGIETAQQQLVLDDGRRLGYDALVIATGSKPNLFGWPGQDLKRVSGMVSQADLAGLEAITPEIKHGVVVGGGLIGVELAEMLHSRGKQVSFLVREPGYWSNALPPEESALVEQVIRQAGIDLRLSTELAEIEDDGQGRACAVRTAAGERIACEYVGLSAGVSPNLSALEGSGIPTGRGVLVDESFRSSVEGVYACGDCAEIVSPDGGRNRIEALWYTGQLHGEVLGAVLAGEARRYDRGIWFNSAKFFDLEWHTYGEVPPTGAPARPGWVQGYWQHPTGLHCLRLVFADGALVGMNALGVRYRHRVFERWIAEARDPEYVLAHLSEANFDPELYRRHEPAMVATLKEQLR